LFKTKGDRRKKITWVMKSFIYLHRIKRVVDVAGGARNTIIYSLTNSRMLLKAFIICLLYTC